jgi:hypothetical protein
MPTRILRDGILTSPRINLLSEPAELFYRRLMSAADDHGRYFADPMLLRSGCYPRKLDKITERDVTCHLAECVAAELVDLYEVGGQRYLVMLDFGQRVQGKSKFPNPPEKKTTPPDSTVDHGESPEPAVIPCLVGGVVEVEDEGGSAPRGGFTFGKWIETLNGEQAIPADHAVFAYAAKVGIPEDFLALAWAWFEKTYGAGGPRAGKRYTRWRGVFQRSVEECWCKAWFLGPDGYKLSTVGQQLQREFA